jgi:hypothetical protein
MDGEKQLAVNWLRQEDRAVAAGIRASGFRGRKVRTPQGSVPDNVRDVRFKAHRRPVPQKRYRLGYPSLEGIPGNCRKGSPGRLVPALG